MLKKLKSDPKARFLRRISQPILALLVLFTLSLATPQTGWATVNNCVFDGTATHCGECCLKFTITIGQATDDFIIGLWYDTTSEPNCLDSACWVGNSTGTKTYQYGAGHRSQHEIVASHLDRMWTGPFPYTFDVYICGSYDCLRDYTQWSWSSGPTTESSVLEPLYIEGCNTHPGCNTGCSYIYTTRAANGCGTILWFVNQSGSGIGGFTVNFNPPLDVRSPCASTYAGATKCGDPNTFVSTGGGCTWTASPPAPNGDVSFTTNGGCALGNCTAIGMYIPFCNANSPYDEEVTLVNPVPCSSDDGFIRQAFKKRDDSHASALPNAGEQNYPNPVDVTSGFKTILPFTTSSKGTAVLKVVSESGNIVFTDREEATYVGKHFFYVSAENLRAGTYYYSIEFPSGTVIASKKMLIVK